MKDESNILQNYSDITKCNVDKRNKRITNSITILWGILFRTLTSIMSVYFTISMIMNLAYKPDGSPRLVITQMAYCIIFFCVTFLLTKLLINDRGIEEKPPTTEV